MGRIHKCLKNKQGFSLVELIVVIAIMVILISLLVPSLVGYIESANNAADVSNAKTVSECIQLNIFSSGKRGDSFVSNPWGSGYGYIYVDDDEMRISNIEIAEILEEHNLIKEGSLSGASSGELRFGKEQTSILCKSGRAWSKYQINFTIKSNNVDITYAATTGNNPRDEAATEKFVTMIGGKASPSNFTIGD